MTKKQLKIASEALNKAMENIKEENPGKTLSDVISKEIAGTNRGSIAQWPIRGMVPTKYVYKLEKLSGVPKEDLRPDMFKDECVG